MNQFSKSIKKMLNSLHDAHDFVGEHCWLQQVNNTGDSNGENMGDDSNHDGDNNRASGGEFH
jgi:hypothetical protein